MFVFNLQIRLRSQHPIILKNSSSVRAHDAKIMSSPWVLFNGATVKDITQTAHFAIKISYTSFYEDSTSMRSSVCQVLGP